MTYSVHIGAAGNSYSDATHALMTQNRDRVYQSNPPLPPEKLVDWEKLWNFWFPFYSSPIKLPDPDGMTAPQREIWFREQATLWTQYLQSREPQKHESGSVWPVVLGTVAVLGLVAGVAGASRRA